MVVEFTVAGHEVIGLNAGPELHSTTRSPDTTEANQRVCQAMLKMGKIEIAELQAAYDVA